MYQKSESGRAVEEQWESSCLVVECSTRDRRAAIRASPTSLRCVLEQEHSSYLITGLTPEDPLFITEDC